MYSESTPAASSTALPTTPEICGGCGWNEAREGHALPGYATHIHETHTTTATTAHVFDGSLYAAVRQACVRSLSCEVVPTREGPVIFGDERSGFVFSYAFTLRDSQARGFQRSYSILLLMADRLRLVTAWPFLVETISSFVTHLQTLVWSNTKQNYSHPQRDG